VADFKRIKERVLSSGGPGESRGGGADPISARTARVAAFFDEALPSLDDWWRRNGGYHDAVAELHRRLIPPGKRILELGCSLGNLLGAVRPSEGIGLDLSQRTVQEARRRHPELHFVVGDAHTLPVNCEFDYVILQDLVGHLEDILAALRSLRASVGEDTRIVLSYYNFVWSPILSLAERLGQKMELPRQNWLSMKDLAGLLSLAGFEIEDQGTELLLPRSVPGVTRFANGILAPLPVFRDLCLLEYFVARPKAISVGEEQTVSVIVACRNEVDNIAECVRRTPEIGSGTELIFVDGASTDGTRDLILEIIEAERGRRDIKLIKQVPGFDYEAHGRDESGQPVGMLSLGKGDAVRKGFAAATGDILMILDADMTVAPEDLPKFYYPLRDDQADFINGVRLVYPIEREAFRMANFLGNKFFSVLFSWLLGQPVKDTLCGTKALRRSDYERLVAGRAHFGEFDPFGDFDLLFGAARLGLRIVDMPVRYYRRVAGHTKVSVRRHGPLLGAMTIVGFRKLKWPRWRARLGSMFGRRK